MNEFDRIKRQKQTIQELRKQELTLREIGKKTGISKQRVHQILNEEHLNESEFNLKERLKDTFEIQDVLKRGFPDFLVVTKDGKICAIEVKSGKDRLSSYQRKACSYLDAGGVPTFISRDGELNMGIIDFLKSGKKNKKLIDVINKFTPYFKKKRMLKYQGLVRIRKEAISLFKKKHPTVPNSTIAEAMNVSPTTVDNSIKGRAKLTK